MDVDRPDHWPAPPTEGSSFYLRSSNKCEHGIFDGPCAQCSVDWRIAATPNPDPVNHPAHYTSHPSGVECIDVTEHMGFCVGNAIKYLWRADLKGSQLEDLRKARWYIDREIARLERASKP